MWRESLSRRFRQPATKDGRAENPSPLSGLVPAAPVPIRGKKVEPSFEAPIGKRPLDGSKSDASASLGEGAEPTLTSSGERGRRTRVGKGDCFLRHWIAQLRR